METIVSLSIFSIGILGVFNVVGSVISAMNNTSNRLTASYLAQEGMETVRNIRDSNFLKINMGEVLNWDEGIDNCFADLGCEAEYSSYSLVSFNDRFLGINSDGFFEYGLDPDRNSIFKRRIMVSPEIDEELKDFRRVVVTVWWEERGTIYNIEAEENIYNWY